MHMKIRKERGLSLILSVVLVITVFTAGCESNSKPSSESEVSSQTSEINNISEDGNISENGSEANESDTIESDTSGPETNKSDANESSQVKTSTASSTPTPSVPVVDLKGRVIKIGTVYSEEYNQDPGQSPFSDLFKEKENEIEKKFNCTIEFVRIAPGSCENIIANAVKANSAPYDLVECDVASARNLARAKTLLDQKTLKSIDLDDKRFNKTVNESFTFNGKVYGSGYENASITGVLFNKRILEANKQPDIYKLYDEGNWTWEAFENIAKATTTPYKPDKTRDVYGITGSTNIIGLALTANAGATVSRNSSGQYIINMASEEGVYAMNWCRKLMFEDGVYDYTVTDWQAAISHFAEGKATFFPFYAWVARDLSRTMIDDVGFVCFPRGPSQDTYINGLYGGKAFVFPKTVKNPEEVATVYYEFASVSAKIWEIYENQYKGWGFDDKSFEILREVAEKYSRTEFSVGPDYSGFSKDMNDSVFKRSGDPAAVMASVKSKFQKATDDYYNEFPQ